MAYESYSFVSWTAGTPLSYDRLGQMSTNISQVKDATDDNPKGIIKLKTVSGTTFGPLSTASNTETEIIALEDSGGVNNLITVAPNRYYRMNLTFPGIRINGPGGEDSTYQVSICEGTPGARANVNLWNITIPSFTYLNSAAGNATLANNALKSNSYPTIVGAGTYTVVLESTSNGRTNVRYYVGVKRIAGASSNNLPTFSVLTNEAKLQLYAEDVGGSL